MAVGPKAQTLALALRDQTVHLWQLGAANTSCRFSTTHVVARLGFSPSGKMLAGMCAGMMWMWDVEERCEVAREPNDWYFNFYEPQFTPDEKRLAIGYTQGDHYSTALWDFSGTQGLSLFDGAVFAFNVAISMDGRLLASADPMGELTLWDVATRTKLSTLQTSGQSVFGLAFSTDGRRIITGNRAGFVDIWDISTRRRTARLDTMDIPLRLGVRSDGSGVFVSGRDGLHAWRAPFSTEIEEAKRK